MKRQVVRLEAAALLGPLAVVVLAMSATPWLSPAVGRSSDVKTSQPRTTAEPDAMRLLEQAAAAPSTTAYRGVQFVSAWTRHAATSLVVEVNHRAGVGTTVHTDGNAQIRASNTFVPATAREPSLAGSAGGLSLLADNYDLTVGGPGSVAGRRTQVVEARRPGTTAPAGRFWIDEKTGLVLRREVYDERGRTTRASAFLEIEVGEADAATSRSPRVFAVWSEEVDPARFGELRAKGWPCPERLADTLRLVDARRGATTSASGKQRILHLSYTDGLSSVSLFEQRGRLDTDKLGGYRPVDYHGGTLYLRDGVPARVMWASDGMVYTLVADAPRGVVDDVVEALPRPDPGASAWGRLGRGMDRVASWFNPFA